MNSRPTSGPTPLSSQLDADFHSGAANLRSLVNSDLAQQVLPASWQNSITELSFSITALWDSIVNAVSLVL